MTRNSFNALRDRRNNLVAAAGLAGALTLSACSSQETAAVTIREVAPTVTVTSMAPMTPMSVTSEVPSSAASTIITTEAPRTSETVDLTALKAEADKTNQAQSRRVAGLIMAYAWDESSHAERAIDPADGQYKFSNKAYNDGLADQSKRLPEVNVQLTGPETLHIGIIQPGVGNIQQDLTLSQQAGVNIRDSYDKDGSLSKEDYKFVYLSNNTSYDTTVAGPPVTTPNHIIGSQDFESATTAEQISEQTAAFDASLRATQAAIGFTK